MWLSYFVNEIVYFTFDIFYSDIFHVLYLIMLLEHYGLCAFGQDVLSGLSIVYILIGTFVTRVSSPLGFDTSYY